MSVCDPELVACQISRLVDSSGGWDVDGFLSTLIATAIGGLIGLAGVWWGFRLQRKHRYIEVLDDSIVAVVRQIADHVTDLQRYQGEYIEFAARMHSRTPVERPKMPNELRVSILLDVAQIRARKGDQLVVNDAIRAADQIREMSTVEVQMGRYGVLAGALSRWRSGIWSVDQVRSSIGRSGTDTSELMETDSGEADS